MKKNILGLLFILTIVALVVGCSDKTNSTDQINEPKQENEKPKLEEKEPIEETFIDEINTNLKEEAIEADWEKVSSNKIAEGTKVFIEGKALGIKPENKVPGGFTLVTGKSDGNNSYNIINVVGEEIDEGAELKIYGTYQVLSGDGGTPSINATIIELDK